MGTVAMAAPPPETASQTAGAAAGPQLPPADRAARAPRRPHFASAHRDGLDKEIVRRWLLSNDAYEHAAAAKDGGTLRSPRGLRSG